VGSLLVLPDQRLAGKKRSEPSSEMIGAPQLIRDTTLLDTTLLTDALRNRNEKRSLPVGLVASGLELETAIIKVAEGYCLANHC
jgi:hypothetical protein